MKRRVYSLLCLSLLFSSLLFSSLKNKNPGYDRRMSSNSIRAWRSGTAANPPRAAERPPDRQIALLRLAGRVAQLSINIKDPARFASERSEIAAELRRIARGGMTEDRNDERN
jgi:hypothetical protein